MSWFTDLTGIHPETRDSVTRHLRMDGDTLISAANGRRMGAGRLSLPSLADLRAAPVAQQGFLHLSEVVADVQDLHADPENADAVFQVASQFNLLEMISPDISPDDGVGRYGHDHTQGPACAIACGAGTIFRNYFTTLCGGTGQTAHRQIDCLADISEALGVADHGDWVMQNGYVCPGALGLTRINAVLAGKSTPETNALGGLLRVGVQRDVQVTLAGAGHHVSQIYCSAMPVAYSGLPADAWQWIARVVLDAAYEATLRAAVQNAATTGCNRVFLTLLGGGAFGNPASWIEAAALRALDLVKDSGLDVRFVSYRAPDATVRRILTRWADVAAQT